MRGSSSLLTLALVLLLGGIGCARFNKKPPLKPFVPPPVTVRTMPDQVLVLGDPPPNLNLYADVMAIPFPLVTIEVEPPEPPRPPVAKTRPATPPVTVTTPGEPTPPPVSVPKLTQILTDDEVRRYRGELDEAANSADRILESTARRPLTAKQTEMVQQVRAFLRQAHEQRDADLVTARNLARRAAILARDLQSTLR